MAQRGRPVVFKGNEKRHILSVIRKHGLTKGQEVLAEEKISISLPTMGKFASEAGIELSRGRPAGSKNVVKKAVKKAAKKAKKKAKAVAAPVAEPVVAEPVAEAAPVAPVETDAPVDALNFG